MCISACCCVREREIESEADVFMRLIVYNEGGLFSSRSADSLIWQSLVTLLVHQQVPFITDGNVEVMIVKILTRGTFWVLTCSGHWACVYIMYMYIQYMYMNEGYLYISSRHHCMVEERVIDTCVCTCPRVCLLSSSLGMYTCASCHTCYQG